MIDNDIGEVNGKVVLEFVAFIRENQKFDSLDSLKKQIQDDIDMARNIA